MYVVLRVLCRRWLARVGVRLAVAAVLVAALIALPRAALAVEPDVDAAASTDEAATNGGLAWLHDLRVGVLAHDVAVWSGKRLETDGVDLNAELVFMREGFALLRGYLHPNLGLSVNTSGETSKLYAGFLWEWQAGFGGFLTLGLDLAVHDGILDTDRSRVKEFGTRVLFRVPIELGYALSRHQRLSVMFDHISNASLASTNEGLDTAGLRYGYVF